MHSKRLFAQRTPATSVLHELQRRAAGSESVFAFQLFPTARNHASEDRSEAGRMARMKAASLTIRTSSRSEMIDVTDQVTDAVRRAGVMDGMAIVYVPHTTAAVTINENADPKEGIRDEPIN